MYSDDELKVFPRLSAQLNRFQCAAGMIRGNLIKKRTSATFLGYACDNSADGGDCVLEFLSKSDSLHFLWLDYYRTAVVLDSVAQKRRWPYQR